MSEFSFAVLIKDKEIKDIAKYIKAENLEAYIFKVNENWNGVLPEEYVENRALAEKLSKKFKTHVFDFVYSEDDGWAYTMFYKGKELSGLRIEYGVSLPADGSANPLETANLSLLKELARNRSALGELESYLINKEQYTNRVFDGVEHFKKALGFEQISWATYEMFDQLPEDQKESLNAILVEKKQKKYNVKKTIIETVEKDLNPRGYFYYKNDPLCSDFAFYKSDYGSLVGLQIYTSEPCGLSGLLKSYANDTNLNYLTEGSFKTFSYNNETELKKILQDITEIFLTKGEEIIKKDRVEPFNAEDVYKNTVDASLGRLGFKRIHTDERIPIKGLVIYEKDGSELVFEHGPYFVYVSCHFGLSKENIAKWGPENSERAFDFRNSEEYVSSLNNLIKNFEEWVLPKL